MTTTRRDGDLTKAERIQAGLTLFGLFGLPVLVAMIQGF